MLIKKIGILYHPMVPATQTKAEDLCRFLSSQGIEAWANSAWETDQAIARLDGTDLILTTGGDGTILRAAQVAFRFGIPITGVNMGTLGFLTEIKATEANKQLSELLAGKGWLDERAMLEAELYSPDSSSPMAVFHALNDVVLARGPVVRIIQVQALINDRPLTTYRADGVIMATATGSTGYSLAAGGPVLSPKSQDLLLVPIVSHLGLGYSLVLSADSVVKLKLSSPNEATLSVDGHINVPVTDGSVISVKLSSQKTRFLRLHPQNHFFTILEEKLKGKK